MNIELNDEQLAALKSLKDNSIIENSQEFSLILDEFVYKNPGVEYLDAITILCESYDIDLNKLSRLLPKSIKLKLAKECGLLSRVYGIDSSLI